MPAIFETTNLRGIEMHNRLVRSATWEGLAKPDGSVTPSLLKIYEDLADGGVGLIVSSYLYVQIPGKQSLGQIGVYSDEMIPGLTEIAAVVHDHGGKIVGQIVHCGGQADRRLNGGHQPVAPSAVDTAFLTGGTGRRQAERARIDLEAIAAATPLKRIAVPDDVAGPVLFLLGKDAGFMTGQVLWVNGGAYMP